MPFFSVVIPVYNRAPLIEATLDSVCSQEFKDYEIIVVDDGSTDKTINVLENYRNRCHADLKIIRQENQGPGAARNLGIRHAQGQYIAFLDSDDLWFPWTLDIYACILNKNKYPALLAGCLLEFSDIIDLQSVQNSTVKSQYYQDYFSSYQHNVLVGAGMAVMRRDIVQVVGGFNERNINAEDHDLALRLGDARGFVNIVSPPTVAYRRHLQNVTGDVGRTFEGIIHLITQESRGAYPGGLQRRLQRLSLITLHTRAVSAGQLSRGQLRCAWYLYKMTLKWHFMLRRWRYIFGFPLQLLVTAMKPGQGHKG